MFPSRFVAAAKLFLALCTALTGSNVMGQTLTVTPVRLQIPPKRNATTLTVTNSGATATGIQVRVYDWTQSDGSDQLTTTDAIVVSPPLATIAPGASQVIRLVLRRSPERKEDAYRVLLDQIPPPAEQGTVRIMLRISLPVFANPTTPTVSHVQFHLERSADQIFLVASNGGTAHDTIRDLDLWTEGGKKIKTTFSGSQYMLAGATRRWPVSAQDTTQPLELLRLSANALTSAITQQVHLVSAP